MLLDNYDSFTYNLVHYVRQCGHDCQVLMNDEKTLDEIIGMEFSAAIISPGPRTPAHAGITVSFIEKFHTTKPLLGICLGHQAIGQFFGATLTKAPTPMHGRTSEVNVSEHPVFDGLPSAFSAMRYHSLLLQNVSTPLKIIGTTSQGEIMAVAHETLPIVGLQFHPESVLTPHGLQMMRNWLAWAHR